MKTEIAKNQTVEDYHSDLIYLVDDEPVMTQLLNHYLTSEGFTNVQQLCDGVEVVEALRTSPPDLLITDLRMPDVSGKYLIHLIENDDAFQTIPVIVISGEEDPDIAAETIRAGAAGFLPKPLDPEALLSCVKQACTQRRRLDGLSQHRKNAMREKSREVKESQLREIAGR